ncbi:putative porin [Pedobacter puniceum]|nr:putative porin [Pedobacter puniceum]
MFKKLFFLILLAIGYYPLMAQVRQTPRTIGTGNTRFNDPSSAYPNQNQPNGQQQAAQPKQEISVDSLRKQLETKKDSIIYTAKFIKVTKEEFLRDSTRLFPLDTSTTNFHRFNPLYDPKSPTMNTGAMGLAYRPMLFEPLKTIGFDLGYHFFDRYLTKPEDIIYYQARSQFTEMFMLSTTLGVNAEQAFHVIHSQNIKPNWNIGAKYATNRTEGYYFGQTANNLNASLWTWYESKNKRYTLLANAIFNTIKSGENGSIRNDSIFTVPTVVQPEFEATRLNGALHNWRYNTINIKQFYNIGKQRFASADSTSALPTQRVSYNFTYNRQKYFFKNEGVDTTGILNNYYIFRDSTSDSTLVNHLKNEFAYSFYLRGKSLSFLKNELKLDIGLVQDFYDYKQVNYQSQFQNLSLKGTLNYSFSDKASLKVDLQQIFQGRNIGDFLYQAQSEIKLSNSVGRLVLGAYSQNQSPAIIYERWFSNHHRWNLNFDNQKTQNLSFAYLNSKFHFQAKAEYFLVSNHLYFSSENNIIEPKQLSSNINLLKLSVGKDFKFGKFTFENYLVYQKTDFEQILRTPEVYTFHSLYMHQDFFKVLKTEFGFDVRYFSEYTAPSYAPAIGQFYNGEAVRFNTWPVADAWIRTNWKRANLFLRYNYVNKGLFSKGYYTVNRYPMPYSIAQFGVKWNFYD